MERTRRIPEDVWSVTAEAVWYDPEELQKLYGKDQQYSRRCMERKRSTLDDVWKGPEALQNMYVKDQKHFINVWTGPEALLNMYGKDQKHFRRCMERTRSTLEYVCKGPEALQNMYGKDQKHL